MTIGEKLLIHRKRAKITQQEIGERMGIKKEQYWTYENDKAQIPIKYLIIACREYNCTPNDIIEI